MSLPQARRTVSGAAASALRALASAVARGVAPISVHAPLGASEANPWYDDDLWTLM